jgi:hypothetical protein
LMVAPAWSGAVRPAVLASLRAAEALKPVLARAVSAPLLDSRALRAGEGSCGVRALHSWSSPPTLAQVASRLPTRAGAELGPATVQPTLA